MLKKIVIITGIVLLCAALYGVYLYNKPPVAVHTLSPDYTIGAAELYDAFESNEAAASTQYVDKILLVSGTIDEVIRTDSTLTVLLVGNNSFGGVSCNFLLENSAVSAFEAGNAITIKGRCTGFLADVMLTDCMVQK